MTNLDFKNYANKKTSEKKRSGKIFQRVLKHRKRKFSGLKTHLKKYQGL